MVLGTLIIVIAIAAESTPKLIDLYLKDPADNIVYFKQKDKGLTNLDRDDLGTANDTIMTSTGKKIFKINEFFIVYDTFCCFVFKLRI